MKISSTLACVTLALGIVAEAGAQTTTTTLNPTADTYIQSGAAGTNYGTSTILLVRQTNSTTNLSRASYLQFNLAALPAGTISSARLRLYGQHETAGAGVPVGVRGSTGTATWGEAALTWTNAYTLAPVDYAAAPIATTTVTGAAPTYYEWDVTSFIASRRAVGHATLSAYTNTISTYRVSFNSKEGANRPQLVVVTSGDDPPPVEGWTPSCPGTYVPQVGLNSNFPNEGQQSRQFHVRANTTGTGPRPVFLAFTGTVQTETQFLSDSRLGELTSQGWIVVAPVRYCQTRGYSCSGLPVTQDTRIWEPWFDASRAAQYATDPGPDVRFVQNAVKCIATRFNVDQSRVFIGGISAGGTIINRALTYASDFFAGGVAASGEWYRTDGRSINETVPSPTTVIPGYCCKRPLPTLAPSINIVVWGGTTDVWPIGSPLANYNPTTKLAANYYATQTNVVTLACTHQRGHIWPGNSAWNTWLANTMASHPKGTPASAFRLTTPPSGFSCRIGTYTDH